MEGWVGGAGGLLSTACGEKRCKKDYLDMLCGWMDLMVLRGAHQ